jgi:hypothetical protein
MSRLIHEFIEELAALEHEQWMKWAKSVLDSEPELSLTRTVKWKTLMVPYSDLTEDMKEHDRKWARKVFEIVKQRIDD